ncbi:GA module-containing protein [Mycoplasmopsis iners]|uniref:GA module-containing protein n=1 Tax=Mycoplasmopsis iners TaxID=76630 RepID=UPI0012EBC2C9|nr:GA module-containing protein [Mycoplasmopsis iners]
MPDKYKNNDGRSAKYKKIIDFAIDENQLQSVYDFFIQLPSFNQINDEDSKNEWIKEIKHWFYNRFVLYDEGGTYRQNKQGSIEWRFMPGTAITDEDKAAEKAIEAFDPKIKDLITFKKLSEYRGRFNTFQEFEKFVLDELQAELKKEVYNAPRAYYDNFVTILKNATVDSSDPNNLNRNIPQDLSNTLLNWLKNSQNLNKDEKAKGGNYDRALEILGDNGLIGINNKIAEIRAKLATYQDKKASFDYKFEPEETEKTNFDSEKEKLTTQLQQLQDKLNGLNTAIDGTIDDTGWNRKKRRILNLTTTNQELATGLSTYTVAEEKLEGLLKHREKVAELEKILSDSSLSDEQKEHYTERINSLGEDADNYAALQTIGDEIKNSIEADSNVEEIINKFSLWTDEQQKDSYREQIKSVYNDSNLNQQAKSAKIKEIEKQIFSKMKENANNLIDQTSLEKTEKDSYKTLINSKNMDENINPYDFPLLKTITKAKIDNLDSLNPAQKEHFKTKIDDSNIDDATKVNSILPEAETANQKMNDYKNTFKNDANSDATNVETIKKSADYTEADNDKKTAFDNALDQRNTDLSSSTNNLTTEQIDQKIAALKQAKEDLNGDENLAEAKQQAKNNLNTTYTYLNDAQKADAIKKIEALTTVNAVKNQDAENKKLDNAMKSYSQSATNIESIRKTTNYTQADNKNTLENLITTKENDINKTSGPNLTLAQVNEKITALNNAVTALNGDERLKAAKDEAIRKINYEYSSLTPKQKERAIELIKSQNTIEDVNNQDATNSALNSSMKTLSDYIANQNNVTAGNNYTYTTNSLRKAYDGNPTKNNNVKGGVIKEAEDLVAALNTDKNSDLMNKEKVDALNEKIKAAINALNGQERYEAEVARLNGLSTATAKVKDATQATNTASQITTDEIEFNNDIPQDAKPVDLNITNTNEVTGKLDLTYKYKSTKENLESVQSTETYTLNNDNALSTLTEQERIDQLVQDKAVTKTVDFNDTDKESFAVSDLTKDSFTTSITPNNNAKVIIDKIEPDPDDSRGAIVTYKLESTKDNLDNQKVISSKSLTTKITGFMTREEKEQKTINSYNESNYYGVIDPLTQPSEFVNKLSEVNIAFNDNDNLDHSNETIVVKSIKSWDDRTGTLVANFVVQSNKNGKLLTSDLKTITIIGYMTEEERLNYLLKRSKNFEFNGDKPQNKTTVDEVEVSQLSGYLLKRNDEDEFMYIDSDDDVELIIDEITARDSQNGTVTFKYHLSSTRTDIPNNKIVSQSRTYTFGIFQTAAERENDNLKLQAEKDKVSKYINNNVPEEEKQALLDELAKANNLDEVGKVQFKAEIEKTIADATKNYPYLNKNQLGAYKADLKSANSTEAIQARNTTASTLNAKMKELSDAVKTELTALTKKTVENDQNNDAKTATVYTLADADKKQAYNNALSVAQQLLNKTNGANSELSAVETVLSNLQTTYGKLNGNQKQNALNQKIDALKNLTPEQKQALKDKIDDATNKDEANKIIEVAENLDKAIGDLKAKIVEAEGKTNSPEYLNDTTENKAKFDKAIQDAKKALKGYETADLGSLTKDQIVEKTAEINNQTSTLNDAIDALDGYRNKFKEDLNNWDLLDASEIKTLQDKVDNLQKQPTQKEKSNILQEGLSLSKTKASNKINKNNYANLSSEEITELLGKVNSAALDETQGHKYDTAVKAIIQEAEQLNQTKQAAINAINGLSDLTQNQKAVFENQVKSLPTSQASTVQETATALNTAILEAKNVVKEQIQKLAKDDQLTYEKAKLANKVADKYRLANTALKQTYDEKLKTLNDLIVKDNVSKTDIDNAKGELISAYNALDGEENKNKKVQAVDKLDNLSENQKDKIKDLLNNATDEEAAQKILEKAQKLGLDISELEKQITSTEAKAKTIIYTNDAQDRKEAVDQALKNAKNKLTELKAKDLSNATADSLNGLANEANQSKEVLKAADEALDGNREVLRNDIKNHFPSLNENQKGLLIAEIEKLPKGPTQEETQAIYDKALEYAQTNAKDELAKLNNLTKAEKDAYIAKIDAAELDKTNKDFAINVKNLLDKAKADEKAKAQAVKTINNLTNLNPAQKLSLTEEVKNNQTSEANNIVKNANTINTKMKAYKDIAEVDKQSTDYVEADKDRQVKYNNQVAIRTEDLGANGTNLNAEQIDAKITELNKAINGLNGEEKVAQAKENAIAKIKGENPIYNNLTDQQKAEAIAKINEKDRVADVNSVDANNALVNGTMATLDTYLNNEAKIKNDINYKGTEKALRKAYDDAIQALKDYKTALNEPSDDTKDILNNGNIEEKINAVHEAINNLNGKEHIQAVREEEIAKINALENINDAQKLALIAKVDKATTPEDVRTVTKEAKALDEKMAELKQAVANNKDTPNSVDYKNATKEKMREFDKAFNDASNLADKENGSAELSIDNIDSLIEKLNVGAQNLDGNEKINNKKAEVKNLINGLEHLNDAQKAALIGEVDKAKLLANVDKVVDKAQTLNNAMGQLKETAKAIDDELSKPDNPKYVAASQEPKANYDEAKAKVDELISKQGSNENVSKVLELEKALIDAKNALDGEKNFEYAEEKAIEKVNENDQLTPEEKQKLIDQIKNTENPSNSDNEEEFNEIKENLDQILGKADLINKIKENENLTPDQKDDLIDDVINANVDDKKNELDNKNKYEDILQNIKDKEKAFEDLNKTPESELSEEDKAKINDNLKDLDPADKDFDNELDNENKKKEAIEEVRKNANLTDEEKDKLIDEIANLDNKQDDLDNSLTDIDKKADLIEKIESNPNLDEEDKNKLIDEVFDVSHNDEKLDEKLDNIDNKLELIDEIKTNDKLDEVAKDKLIEETHNVNNDSEKADDELANVKAKEEAINKVVADDELTPDEKAKLVEEILNIDETNTPSEVNDQLNNVDKKADLYKEINNSDLPDNQKAKLVEELDSVDSNAENTTVIFDNIKDQLNQLDKINKDETLTNDDKAKLAEDVLNNNPNDENYNEIAKNIDKKQDAIDAIRQNENLTDEQKDQMSNNIASLDVKDENFNNNLSKENAKADLIAKIQGNNNLTKEEKDQLVHEVNNIDNDDPKFYDKLTNDKAKLDLIDKLHQEANEGKITEKAKDALINEVLNIANNENTIANIDKVKAKDKLIQQVKASDVLNDKTKASLINNILDNNATNTEFANKHNQIAQLYVDAEELAKAKNDLVDLTKSKKFEKLTKDQKVAINKAITVSDEILDNLNSHTGEDVVKQTTIDKELAKSEVDKNWSWILFLIAALATATSLGLLLAIPAVRNKLLK